MDSWKEFCKIQKKNPIEHYEYMLGFKLSKIQKIQLRLYSCLIDYLYKLLEKEGGLLQEILAEPFGTTRYEILKLHSIIVELKIDLVKSILKIR